MISSTTVIIRSGACIQTSPNVQFGGIFARRNHWVSLLDVCKFIIVDSGIADLDAEVSNVGARCIGLARDNAEERGEKKKGSLKFHDEGGSECYLMRVLEIITRKSTSRMKSELK